MKKRPLSIYFIFFLLIYTTSSFAQRYKYEVKVVLNSAKDVKGILQKISTDGISVTDFRGKNYFFTPQTIHKIKVRRKGLNFIESLATGTGIGLAAGTTILLATHSSRSDLAAALAVGFVAVGAVGGALGGLVAEALNTELVLVINNNTTKFKNEYIKLEKYLK